ncbi:12979_t:CDS:2 [Entrophospora sp. SA101]|nr:15320_t:CDS:2 [Entrophospora candida]CAG8471325.1 4548_t:CDS:2 [Entrophospora candida]CAH1764008.1 9450_t:CDS:2 [Entrophospora sp. SA101]CAJ0899707.1 12979_t:CDS:2 [Entrophospora sp. SA101]
MPRNGSRNFITEEKPSSYNDTLDQSALPNLNSNWVNYKGAWIIHIIIIFCIKIVFSSIPKVSPEASWTFTNLSYMFGSFIMFHWVKGVPFDFNSGAYDGLTLWEQIDNGAQYTPAKKYLTAVPIVLFLLSTHYTHYDVFTFLINFTFLLVVLIAKLPQLHKVRLFGINKA